LPGAIRLHSHSKEIYHQPGFFIDNIIAVYLILLSPDNGDDLCIIAAIE
jgi:hypothetical protein